MYLTGCLIEPFPSSRAEILGKQALNVATDIIDGKSFKDSVKVRIQIFASQTEAIQQSGSEKEASSSVWVRVAKRARTGRLIFAINMTFIHVQSFECSKSELDVFSEPPTQTSIAYGNYVHYHHLSCVTDSDQIEFDVSSSRQIYLDFSNTHLVIKVKLIEEIASTLPITITRWVNMFLTLCSSK